MTPKRRLKVLPDFPERRKFSVSEWAKSYTTCFIILFGPFLVFVAVFYAIWKVVRG